MSSGPRYPRSVAIPVADEIMDALSAAHAVTKCLWVGSLRRGLAEVGDVEILFLPKVGRVKDPGDLFGETVEADLAEEVFARLLRDKIIAKRLSEDGRTTWGKQNRLATHVRTGMPVDLFAATDANWFNLLVCRTGPAALNVAIASAARAREMAWDPYSPGFNCAKRGDIIRRVSSEREVFEAVGLQLHDPIARDVYARTLKANPPNIWNAPN